MLFLAQAQAVDVIFVVKAKRLEGIYVFTDILWGSVGMLYLSTVFMKRNWTSHQWNMVLTQTIQRECQMNKEHSHPVQTMLLTFPTSFPPQELLHRPAILPSSCKRTPAPASTSSTPHHSNSTTQPSRRRCPSVRASYSTASSHTAQKVRCTPLPDSGDLST